MAYIARYYFISTAFLLSIDGRIRTLLNNICWFTSINALEDDASFESDEDAFLNWAQVWCSARKLCVSVYRPTKPVKARRRAAHSTRLHSRKRYELAFLCRISSLHQLRACHHASGELDDAASSISVFSESTMRSCHCAFFIAKKCPSKELICLLFA